MYKTSLILIFFLLFILVNLEVTKFVTLLSVGNNTQPVTKVVLLQILLCQILQVSVNEQQMTVRWILELFLSSQWCYKSICPPKKTTQDGAVKTLNPDKGVDTTGSITPNVKL